MRVFICPEALTYDSVWNHWVSTRYAAVSLGIHSAATTGILSDIQVVSARLHF